MITTCCGFADCPCVRCRDKRLAVSGEHPHHSHPSDVSYCLRCRAAERDRYDIRSR